MKLNTDSIFVRGRLYTLILVGVILVVFGTQQVMTIWTPERSLIPLKGTLKNCDTYITEVSSQTRYGYNASSNKAELILYLYEYKKKFLLMENIGKEELDEKYENIRNKIDIRDSVTIWIKKSEINEWQPSVFKLATDYQVLLSFDDVRFKDRPLTAFVLFLGVTCIAFPVYLLFPYLFKSKKASQIAVQD